MRIARLLSIVFFVAFSSVLVWGGASLLAIGGTPYYMFAGILMLAVALLIWLRSLLASWLYAAYTVATILWALREVGLDCWGLFPRLAAPAVLGLWFALPFVRRGLNRWRVPWPVNAERWDWAVHPLLLTLVFGLLVAGYQRFVPARPDRAGSAPIARTATEWTSWGGAQGDKFSTADQITPANVKRLKVAWVAHTGAPYFEGPPLKIGDAVIICTARSVISVDADTGQQNWRYEPGIPTSPDPLSEHCRGVSYYKGNGTAAICDQRLLWPTVDDHLHEIDLSTGQPCADFGDRGVLDLGTGIGKTRMSFHLTTSPPLIIGDLAVFGSKVKDQVSEDMPSGVVRAVDVKTGQLIWAWDLQQPHAAQPLRRGEIYPRSSPNAWGVFSADPSLGLIYVGTGTAPTDNWNGHKTSDQMRYEACIVALDVKTGEVKWSFQTVHMNLWDSDVGAQPTIVDLDRPTGREPALVVPTKSGEIFVLDRRTGVPIVPVEERPTPQADAAPGEQMSPTQPYPIGFPNFLPARLREVDMWGATMLDQMFCRIKFRRAHYEGEFTPPGLAPTISYPDSLGVIDWGGVSVDPEREVMFVNATYLPLYKRLVPRAEFDAAMKAAHRLPGVRVQSGAPYVAQDSFFTSILGVPCNRPPWGEVAAVDLRTDKLLWRRPFGSSRDVAPLGIALPTGIFNISGSVITRGGLAFIGATMDHYVRAFNTETGEELWRARIPAGGQTNPITYISSRSGRQYVVFGATGHAAMRTTPGDSVIAYALPQ